MKKQNSERPLKNIQIVRLVAISI
uniref:Uncharacterized protein n=1 Tax=Rhizophora mucronata TaxID=61149 RepID=A0A2P2R2D0_RHIMU